MGIQNLVYVYLIKVEFFLENTTTRIVMKLLPEVKI